MNDCQPQPAEVGEVPQRDRPLFDATTPSGHHEEPALDAEPVFVVAESDNAIDSKSDTSPTTHSGTDGDGLRLALARLPAQAPPVGLPDPPWIATPVGGHVVPSAAHRLVLVSPDARQAAWEWASGDLEHERGGFLLGSFGELEDGTPYTVIQVFVPAIGGIGTRSSFKFTSDAWTHGETVKQAAYPALRWVGWFHSHPGYGVFLSHWDTSLFDLSFRWDHHVAYVIDPCRSEEGLFVRKDGARVEGPALALYVVESKAKDPAIPGQSEATLHATPVKVSRPVVQKTAVERDGRAERGCYDG